MLSGRARSGQTEEQSLAKLNDQCDRLIRQIETSIERAESARADRTVPGEGDIVRGVPKPGEDICAVSPPDPEDSARGRNRGSAANAFGATNASRRDAPRIDAKKSPASFDAEAPGGRNAHRSSGAEPSARRAYPAGAFRDDFSEFSETNEDDDSYEQTVNTTRDDDDSRRRRRRGTKTDEAEADDAFRAGFRSPTRAISPPPRASSEERKRCALPRARTRSLRFKRNSTKPSASRGRRAKAKPARLCSRRTPPTARRRRVWRKSPRMWTARRGICARTEAMSPAARQRWPRSSASWRASRGSSGGAMDEDARVRDDGQSRSNYLVAI